MKMNSKKFLTVALVLATVSIFVGVNFYPNVSAQSNEVKAVMDVLTREAAAVESGDLDTLDKIWANDESVTVFESGHANYGWNDYRNNHLAPELKEFTNTKYSFSDLKVKVSSKTAWATFKYKLSADFKERKIESSGLGTVILEKRGKLWRIVHWHSSSPPRRPSPTQTPTPSP
jgi:ketosteroid isomerase-like protein